ncbi:PKD domain-containing protein [Geodermatophilus sp. SYSU D01036]
MSLPRRLGLVATALLVGGGVVAVPAGEAQAATVSATLVATRPTHGWARPSPDPAGITYDPASGRLIISDCEVDETPLYAGTNLFRSTLDGAQSADDPGGTTLPWSREPTGVGYRASDGRLFVSDDDADRIFEVRAGADGRHGTPDDGVTSFSVRSLGSGDPEDVAIDMELTSDNHLLVVDGGTKKIYDFGPGANGVFDGQPADGGDDTVTAIDVGRHGALDPEGVAFHAGRNTILALDGPSKRVYELNRQGQLLNIVDIRAAQPRKAAGITLAPASNGSGALNWYIVDRGVDNDSNPQENDGRFYEMAVDLPPVGAPTNAAPRVSAGPDQRTGVATPASLAGTADDDGLPSPPAAVSVTWSAVSGPGTVTFANASAAATTATFSAPGTYVLRLTASDGELQASDDVTLVVDPAGSGVVDVPVAAGTDDAEERSSTVSLTGTDLELVVDGTTTQTVGLRFAGLSVPPGATLTAAHVQFSVDEATTAPASLVVAGQAADNAPTFAAVSKNVSSRPRTAAQVSWVPPSWPTAGARGAEQRTPSLVPVLQEIVGRPGWASGNAVVLVVTGSGTRNASASERGAAKAPVLHVEWTL